MHRKGVNYDVGTVYAYGGKTRPHFSGDIARREMGIIRRDLHCNTVKIGGHDMKRVVAAATFALAEGLETWIGPCLFDKGPRETLEYIGRSARIAEAVRQGSPGRVVFCVGSELLLFMRGILPGRTVRERFSDGRARELVRSGAHAAPLNAFLAQASEAARREFHGPITYAALPFEGVDWGPFDLVGVDHYWDIRIADRFVEMLRPFFATGKPVVVTGTGSRAYRGAHTSGTLGFGVVDYRSQFLHGLPLVGRFVRPRLRGDYVRDENEQARHLVSVLALLDQAGVDGVFIDSFVDPVSPYSEDPRHDLDMSSLSLVKSYEHRTGSVYPDMPWDPKEAFRAVAEYYSR